MSDPTKPSEPKVLDPFAPVTDREEASASAEAAGPEDVPDEADEAPEEPAAAPDTEPPAGDPPATEDRVQEPGERRGEVVMFRQPGAAPAAQTPAAATTTPPPKVSAADFPALVQRIYDERDAHSTGEHYSGALRRFLTWVEAHGMDPRDMPADAANRWAEETYPNAGTRSRMLAALRTCFEIAIPHDVGVARQEILMPSQMKSRNARAAAAVNGAANGTNGTAGRYEAPVTGPATVESLAGPLVDPFAPVAPVVPVATAAQPSAPASAAIPRAAPRPSKPTSAVPSLAGRVRITKRIDGSEGIPGAPVGSLVVIGTYSASDLDGEGSPENFLTERIRPIYGPFRGQRPTVFHVDRLDAQGNPMQGGSFDIPVMPAPYTRDEALGGAANVGGGGYVPAPVQSAAPVGGAIPGSSITGDRMLDYIVMEARKREEDANRRIEEIKQQAQSKGMDPTMLMLLMERVKPEPLDVQSLVREFRRANPEPKPPPPPPPPEPLPMPGALDGLDFGAPPRPSASDEALKTVMETQGRMLETLLTRLMAPPPAPPPPATPAMDFERIIALAQAIAPKPPPESPLAGKLLEAAIAKMLAPPERPKSIAEVLKEVVALREASETLLGSPEEKPPTAAEVVMAAFEHAPQIGEAIGHVLAGAAAAKQGAAPQQQQALPPAQAAQPTPTPPMPQPAQQAFVALAQATDEQSIIDAMFDLQKHLGAGPDPWLKVPVHFSKEFLKADNRIEVLAAVTHFVKMCGATRLIPPAKCEAITAVFHKHYTPIHSALSGGQEKVLDDAESAEPAGEEPPVYEDVPPEDGGGQTSAMT